MVEICEMEKWFANRNHKAHIFFPNCKSQPQAKIHFADLRISTTSQSSFVIEIHREIQQPSALPSHSLLHVSERNDIAFVVQNCCRIPHRLISSNKGAMRPLWSVKYSKKKDSAAPAEREFYAGAAPVGREIFKKRGSVAL